MNNSLKKNKKIFAIILLLLYVSFASSCDSRNDFNVDDFDPCLSPKTPDEIQECQDLEDNKTNR